LAALCRSDRTASSCDGVVFAINPHDATWVDQSYWDNAIAKYRGTNLDYLASMYARPREQGSLSFGGADGLTAWAKTSSWNPQSFYDEQTFAPALADLKATQAKRMTHNFVTAGLQCPTTDWFNDEDFVQRNHNFALLARFAKQSGLKGIMFDDEEYGQGAVWFYPTLRKRGAVHGKGFEETRAMARQRGRDFAKAICAEFPDILFWTFHGYGTTAHAIEMGLPEYKYSLRSAFYDGILEGGSAQMILVDGGEIAYGFSTKEQFEHGRRMILEAPIEMGLTQVPDLFRKKVRCGFAVWPDYYGKINPADLELSYFSPGRLQRALYWALEVGDGYVWLWGESWSWWMDGPDEGAPVDVYQGRRGLPRAYWDAVTNAHFSPGDDTSPVRGTPTGLATRGRHGCIDGQQLAQFLGKNKSVFQLPVKGWSFKLDDWGNIRDDPKTFDKPITIGRPWSQQGFTGSDSVGWYRLEFMMPENLKGKKLHFYFPKVDGSIWLASTSCANPQEMAWRYVEYEPQSQRKPFVLTNDQVASYFFEPGKLAVVVLKVQGHDGGGGIMAPIHILATK